jgi:ABC-type branched-subunit amino acid transport system permease subunit
MGYGLLLQSLVYPMAIAFGKSGIVVGRRPSVLESDTAFYFFVLATVGVGVALLEVASRARISRVLRALADSPTAVQSLGISPTGPRVLVFCLCTFTTALAGGLIVTLYGAVTYTNFDFFLSLLWLTVLVTAGVHGFWGALLAGVLFFTVPNEVDVPLLTELLPVLFGVQAILLAQRPNGLVGETKDMVDRVRQKVLA